MDELKQIRKRLDSIDTRIVSLLEQRFNVVGEAALHKQYNNLPVEDPDREKELISKLASETNINPLVIKDIYDTILYHSRDYQQQLQHNNKEKH